MKSNTASSFTISFASMLLTFVACMTVVHGHGTGAPASRCGSLLPPHGTKQDSQSPYTLRIDGQKTIYTALEIITVCVDGGDFQGLILQARSHSGSSTTPYGIFTEVAANTKLMTCTSTNDTVTHSNTATKGTNTCFKWIPPASDAGVISFIATINQEKTKFWTGIRSSSLTSSYVATPMTAGGAPVTTAAANTTTPTNTSPAGSYSLGVYIQTIVLIAAIFSVNL